MIIIDKIDEVSISLLTEDVHAHFMEQPIYGIVDCITDESGNELIDTGTSPAGNVATGTKDENMTTGRNQNLMAKDFAT